jgi:hypothetical protein
VLVLLVSEANGQTYSAAYCTSKVAGMPAHVAGALPPAVLMRYTSSRPPVAPRRVTSFNQGTAPAPTPPWPTLAPAGAGTELFLAQGAKPIAVCMSKSGVVELEKKWRPERARFDGVRLASLALVMLNCSATLGSARRRSGYVAAIQEAL